MSRIEDYVLIGDCQTSGLVSRNGSIDWLCFPRFDSPACFSALLGRPEHGRWKLAPAAGVTSIQRRYVGDSLVLETTFTTETGQVSLTDFMPRQAGVRCVVRTLRGLSGSVPMEFELAARFDYGSITPWVRAGNGRVSLVAGPERLCLTANVPFSIDDWILRRKFEIHEGETESFVLDWQESHNAKEFKLDARVAEQETIQWWNDWAKTCNYQGAYRDAVLRSLITLKALTYEPTGGIVAAPTTSLPEHIGGQRNWDYRYCWLRDATFTLTSLIQCGYQSEAIAWREWLLRAIAGKAAELHIMYGIAGERRLPEMELPWLPGYEDSKPVRIGNGAYDQFQLDVFGEVIDCLHLARMYELGEPSGGWRIEQELLARLEEVWQEPDEGIWEVRGPKQHFTHSKLMAWVAFDRAIKDAERYGLPGPTERWKELRKALHAEICERGFSTKRNAFVQHYGSNEIDAAVLVMPELGFLPAMDPRVLGTVAAVEEDLVRDGFVDRYRSESGVDGLPKGEGAFLLCTFWLADNYAMQGRTKDAEALFERLLAIRNDLGLLAEEYDPVAQRQLGNFPQAFSHLGLINTARNLTQQDKPCEARYRC